MFLFLFFRDGMLKLHLVSAQCRHVRTWLSFGCAQELRDEFDIDVRVLGIMSSSRMLLSETALDLSTWREQFQQ